MRSWSVTTGDWTGTKSGCEGWRRRAAASSGESSAYSGRARRQVLELGRRRAPALQTREVGLAGQETGRPHQSGQAAQQGRGVGGVAGLLGGPEGPRLGQLALALLGERLGDGGAYLVGGVARRCGRAGTGPRPRPRPSASSVRRAATCLRSTVSGVQAAAPTAAAAAVVSSRARDMALTDVLPVQVDPPTSYISLTGGPDRLSVHNVTNRTGLWALVARRDTALTCGNTSPRGR